MVKIIDNWRHLSFFGIHTANVVQLTKRIEQRTLLFVRSLLGRKHVNDVVLAGIAVCFRMEIDEEPVETTGMIYKHKFDELNAE